MIVMDPSLYNSLEVGRMRQKQHQQVEGKLSPSTTEEPVQGAAARTLPDDLTAAAGTNTNNNATRPTKKPRMDTTCTPLDAETTTTWPGSDTGAGAAGTAGSLPSSGLAAQFSASSPASYNLAAPLCSGIHADLPLAYASLRNPSIAELSTLQQQQQQTRRDINLFTSTHPQVSGLGMLPPSLIEQKVGTQDTLEQALLIEQLKLQMYNNFLARQQQQQQQFLQEQRALVGQHCAAVDSLLLSANLPNTRSTHASANADILQGTVTNGSQQDGKMSSMEGQQLRLPRILLLPEDEQRLSEYQCLLRKHIEAFEATADNVNSHSRGRSKAISVGQVGIRCTHCKGATGKGSAYFPSTLMGLYQSSQNMALYHVNAQDGSVCKDMPTNECEEFNNLMSCKSTVGGGKDYWASAGRAIGLVDTPNGIRFQPGSR